MMEEIIDNSVQGAINHVQNHYQHAHKPSETMVINYKKLQNILKEIESLANVEAKELIQPTNTSTSKKFNK